MGVLKDLKERFDRERVELDLDDIQGLVLRSRPEPYVGAHAMLTVEEAAGGRDFVRRLAEHVASAQDWADDLQSWTGVAISFAGGRVTTVRRGTSHPWVDPPSVQPPFERR